MADVGPLAVILNPAASGGRGKKLIPRLREELKARGVPFSLLITQEPGEGRQLVARAHEEGARRILAVGGDGTVHEIANGVLDLPEPPPPVAVLPVGTGNDFFRMIGPSAGVSRVLDTVLHGEVQYFEVGWAKYDGGSSHFINLLGVGLDVEVLRRRSQFRRLTGLPQYLAALTAAVASFRPPPLRIHFPPEDKTWEGPVMLAVLTVGPSIGGGFLLNPDASPFDGFLDYSYVDPVGLWKVARYVPRVIRGTHRTIPEFHCGRVRQIRLSRPDGGPFFFELDGELMPEQTTVLDVQVRARVLPVLTPAKGGVG